MKNCSLCLWCPALFWFQSWDPELETFAKDYAEKCTWEHNKERGRRGENLFAMSGSLDVKIAVETWYNEYQFYNYTTLECKEGEMCGHYTQVSDYVVLWDLVQSLEK